MCSEGWCVEDTNANQAAEQVVYVKHRHPEVIDIFGDFTFCGRGQKKTAVADLPLQLGWECLHEMQIVSKTVLKSV